MNEQPQHLKLVVAYDRNRNEYSLPAHNLTAVEASDYLNTWSHNLRDGCSLIVLDQIKRHRTEEAKNCRACRETVARSAHLEPQPKFVRSSE